MRKGIAILVIFILIIFITCIFERAVIIGISQEKSIFTSIAALKLRFSDVKIVEIKRNKWITRVEDIDVFISTNTLQDQWVSTNQLGSGYYLNKSRNSVRIITTRMLTRKFVVFDVEKFNLLGGYTDTLNNREILLKNYIWFISVDSNIYLRTDQMTKMNRIPNELEKSTN